jgi:predicted  nucleic acid-binding Zn-ribbon protein
MSNKMKNKKANIVNVSYELDRATLESALDSMSQDVESYRIECEELRRMVNGQEDQIKHLKSVIVSLASYIADSRTENSTNA